LHSTLLRRDRISIQLNVNQSQSQSYCAITGSLSGAIFEHPKSGSEWR
jgi:hypothetical protein